MVGDREVPLLHRHSTENLMILENVLFQANKIGCCLSTLGITRSFFSFVLLLNRFG